MNKIITYEEFEQKIDDLLLGRKVEINLLDKIIYKNTTIFCYLLLAQLCEKTYKEKNEHYQVIKKEFLKLLENIDNDFLMEEYDMIFSSLKNTDIIETLCNRISPLQLVEKMKSKKVKNAKLFIKYAEYYNGYFKNNMFFKLPDGKIFLEFLLEFDRRFILEILSEEDKSNLQISQILKVKDSDSSYLFEKPWYCTEDDGYFEYLKKDITEYYFTLDEDEKKLLDEFDELFNESENDRFIISRIKSFYIYQFAKKIPNTFRDLRFLLDIKISNPSFTIIKKPNFSTDGDLLIYRNNIFKIELTPFAAYLDGMIAHEITHLFHYYSSEMYTPKEFEEIRIRNTNNLDAVTNKIIIYLGPFYGQISEKVKRLEEEIKKDRKFLKMVNIETECFFEEYRKKIIRNYYEKFDGDLLIYVSEHLISKEQYLEYVKKWRAKFLAHIKVMKEGSFEIYSITDLINAFYNGKVEKCISKIQRDYGIMVANHHEEYFSSNSLNSFSEIIADYAAIKKSEKYEYYNQILINIMGIEVVDFLEKFYNDLCMDNSINQRREV